MEESMLIVSIYMGKFTIISEKLKVKSLILTFSFAYINFTNLSSADNLSTQVRPRSGLIEHWCACSTFF